MKKYIITTISIVLFLNYAFSQIWERQNPNPFGTTILKVQKLNATSAFAGGGVGAFFKTNDKGLNWVEKSIKYEQGDIWDIAFKDSLNIWVATDAGRIYHTQNGGDTWQLQYVDGNGNAIRSISFLNDTIGWAVGDFAFSDGIILRTIDGGKNWTSINFPKRTSGASYEGFFFVKALDGDTAIALSYSNTFYKMYNGGITIDTTYLNVTPPSDYYEKAYFLNKDVGFVVGPESYIAKTTNGGKSWTKAYGSPDSTDYFTAVYFLDANNGWVTGFGNTDTTCTSMYITNDGGGTWTKSACYINNPYSRAESVTFFDATAGIVASGSNVYRSTDGGLNFSSLNQGITLSTLNSVDFINANNGSAVGASGVILTTVNGGKTWVSKVSNTTKTLNKIAYATANNVWAVGASGTIVNSSDGGNNWAAQISNTTKALNSVCFVTAQEGYAVGALGTLLKTMNGGSSWNAININTTKNIRGIIFINNTKGWLVGDSGLVMHTSNGGNNWQMQTSGILTSLRDVSFVDSLNGWAAGNSARIIYTSDGGLTWVSQPSNTTGTINSIKFVDKQNGWFVKFAEIHKTNNGGLTWVKDTLNISGAFHTAIDFVDLNNGWVVGGGGVILKYSNSLTSINPLSNDKFEMSFYPNPTNGDLVFDVMLKESALVSVKIYSITGQEIDNVIPAQLMHSGINNTRYQLQSSLSDGLYFIRTQVNEAVMFSKIILKK